MNNRRNFLKLSGLAGLSITSGALLSGPTAGAFQRNNSGLDIFSGVTATAPQKYERNEQIEADYNVALRVLKPTKKQLERGLELHRNSLVFDTYGFMPRAAVDPGPNYSSIRAQEVKSIH